MNPKLLLRIYVKAFLDGRIVFDTVTPEKLDRILKAELLTTPTTKVGNLVRKNHGILFDIEDYRLSIGAFDSEDVSTFTFIATKNDAPVEGLLK